MKKEYRLTFRLSADQADILMRYAIGNDLSVSAAVRDAIWKLRQDLHRDLAKAAPVTI
jgi:hypothetical protein